MVTQFEFRNSNPEYTVHVNERTGRLFLFTGSLDPCKTGVIDELLGTLSRAHKVQVSIILDTYRLQSKDIGTSLRPRYVLYIAILVHRPVGNSRS